MAERFRLTLHGLGSVYLLITLFLGLSLAGYDPNDPPTMSAVPCNDPPVNPCGPVGAALAHLGYRTLGGPGSAVLVAGLASLTLLTYLGRSLPRPVPTTSGLVLGAIVVATVFQALRPGLRPSAPIGSGGEVGALAFTLLFDHVGRVGLSLCLIASGVVSWRLAGEGFVLLPARLLVERLRQFRREAPVSVPTPFRMPRPTIANGLPVRPGLPSPQAVPLSPIVGPANDELVPAGVSEAHLSRPRAFPISRERDQLPAAGAYELPPLELLDPPTPFPVQEHETRVHDRALLLEKTLLEHGCVVRVVQIDTGPVITQFEIELEPGLRVSRIISLSNDLAIALAVPSVRIVAPIPGKTTVGIEVPNERRAIVKLGEVMGGVDDRLDRMKIPLFLGKDVKGAPLAFDLTDMPHLLIAGRTGTGKSVCLNAMILSILMSRTPDEVKLILIDPKMVELSQFKRIPHLMHPVVTDMKKAESLLAWACEKMDERYAYLARAGVRNIQSYNQLGAEEIYHRLNPETEEERARIPTYMPYIVIVADEMADLMMTAAKEVESHIVRLAQKARAVGMHLIVATQKPTVDVITGLIKGNLPARIAFQVASKGDSRVVLDEMGADKLLGNGDMLFLVPGTSHILRAQGTYVSDAEVFRICGYLERYPVEFSRELMQLQVSGGPGRDRSTLKERDELYEPAIEIVVREGRGSCSLLQRALGIGYGRAARLIDFMAEDGIVGEFKSGSAREVLYTWEEWEALKNHEAVGRVDT